MLTITPVFEAPWYEDKPRWPWPIANKDAFSFIPITPDCDDATIGSFFAGFAEASEPPDERPAVIQLEDILEDGALIRSGGMMFQADGITIQPSCCGDLDAATEWMRFLSAGVKPWAGHDPTPWATADGDDIVIWSDGGLEDSCIEPCIRTTKQEFEACLASACQVLAVFGELCGKWLVDHDVPKAAEIHARIRADFDFIIESTRLIEPTEGT